MIALYHQFLYGLKWNTIGSLVYQVVYIIHHIALFRAVDHAFYGMVGTLFSALFLAVPLLNLGFNLSLAPFFIRLSSSRSRFLSLFVVPFLLNTLMVSLFAAGVYAHRSTIAIWCLRGTHLDTSIAALICALMVTETTQKTLRTLVQIAFLTRAAALLEIFKMLLYAALVWGWHYLGHPFTLMNIFLPMLIISVIDLLGLSIATVTFYRSLPRIDEPAPPHSWYTSMFYNRTAMYAHEALSLIFSHNFLVPFFAASIGFCEAGIFKFVSQLTIFVTVVLQKIIGMSSNALLSHTKDLPLATKRDVFQVATTWLYQILYALIIFLLINSGRLIAWQAAGSLPCDLTVIYLFMFTSLSENFLLTYQKFYITEEKTHYLACINAGAIIGFVALLQLATTYTWSRDLVYLGVLVIRLTGFIATGLVAFLLWRITPAWRLQGRVGAAALIFSLLFFLAA